MNKEEYAQLNYLLAKLRYEALDVINNQHISEETYNTYTKLAEKIYYIQKFMFIDGKEDK